MLGAVYWWRMFEATGYLGRSLEVALSTLLGSSLSSSGQGRQSGTALSTALVVIETSALSQKTYRDFHMPTTSIFTNSALWAELV